MWRYREALPIDCDESIVSFDEGFTALLPLRFGLRSALIKQDHLLPSGSYKDRGASVLISKVKELKIERVVEDSSGNAGAAIAAYCARASIACDIFVPADTAEGKLAQIKLYGAALNRIPGSREDTSRAVLAAAKQHYYASHAWNPYFFHGTKTYAYEVCEQLGWKAPDAIVLPAGNGTLVLGAFIGFGDLLRAGVVRQMPKLIAVQSALCAPLHKAFVDGLDRLPVIAREDTVAEGIAIAEPIRGMEIVSAVRSTGGHFVAVNDEEVVGALRELCLVGIYPEPTAAATIAGLKKYLNECRSAEIVISVITGHGLKATEKLLKIAGL